MAARDPPYGLKEMLQSAVQSVQWTYIVYWQFCSQQEVLEWRDGYYNGSIRTRKTVQPMEVSTDEAALDRSEQLKELYDSLAAGDQPLTENHQQSSTIRRPSVALSPEDLTDSEWFYLMCISFSFPLNDRFVGEAYAKQQHLWLSGAHETDSKVFTRAILAKSAHIQTATFIPLLNGVVELGTTKKVEETIEFVRHVKLFFELDDHDNLIIPSPNPTHSAHSSNTTLSPHQIPPTNTPLDDACNMDEDVENEADDEDEEENEGYDENGNGLDFREPQKGQGLMVRADLDANELLQVDMCHDIGFRIPNDGSSNLNSRFSLLDHHTSHNNSFIDDSTPRWSDNLEMQNLSTVQLQISETLQQELANEDTHYSNTVSTILNNQSTHDWQNPTTNHNSFYKTQSSFTTWIPDHPKYHNLPAKTTSNSQKVLKYILFTVPFLNSNLKSAGGLRKTVSHEELSANHVLAERRRREKLNELFIVLRSLVPLVTKMDKASILGDTIEYVKQLRKKIQDLEASAGCHDGLNGSKTKKIRAANGVGKKSATTMVQVDVSIIESDALVEMKCVHREGLLLDVMKKLRELGLEITTVQSSVEGMMSTVEMRAKVKWKGNHGKKVSIMQVKRAINQIISPM